VFGEKAPGLGFVRTVLALKTTRVGQLMDQLIAGLASRIHRRRPGPAGCARPAAAARDFFGFFFTREERGGDKSPLPGLAGSKT
jgi:hypothetical protein